MARRKSDGAPGELFDLLSTGLVHAPLWLGPAVAIGLFSLFYWLVPLAIGAGGDQPLARVLPGLMRILAWVFGGVALVAWISASITRLGQRRRFQSQTGLASIRNLSWRQFEELLATAYRQMGYTVISRGGTQPDGGVDIELHGPGGKTLVQCKHWKKWKVGAPVVHRLLGVMQHEGAARGVLVTSGNFTEQARRFALGKAIDLVDGAQLASLIHSAQRQTSIAAANHKPGRPESLASSAPGRVAAESASPACPLCGSPMARRTARRGVHSGEDFWGCTRYPNCTGKRRA